MPLQPMNRTTTAQTITEYFAQKIRSGDYQPGDRLPSERELMAQLSVARSTIREAMQSLYSRNLIEIRAGEGTFVKGYPIAETLLTKVKILLDVETEMDDLLDAQRLFAALKRRSVEPGGDGSAEINPLTGDASRAASDPTGNSEIALKWASPQYNRALAVLSDLIDEVIYYRQRIG